MKRLGFARTFFGAAAPFACVAGALGVLGEGCGARSGLLLEEAVATNDAAVSDAAIPEDAPSPRTEDAGVPPLDAEVPDVVPIPACADASDTLIYTVTEQNTLLKFNPSSAEFTVVGTLVCPDPRMPFSMAVDRLGNAYVLYFEEDGTTGGSLPGNIFKVNLNDATCESTSYVPGQDGFLGFGMGFTSDDTGGGETLYVASGDTSPARLGAINENTLKLSVVGSFEADLTNAELTGTGDGRLFAFYPVAAGGSAIGQLDKKTAAVLGQAALPQVTQGTGWAFAFWGGNFYTFTAPDQTETVVQRYDPNDGTVVQVATYPEIIDGAGVSTCAPVQ